VIKSINVDLAAHDSTALVSLIVDMRERVRECGKRTPLKLLILTDIGVILGVLAARNRRLAQERGASDGR
jgi:hypothetical protein